MSHKTRVSQWINSWCAALYQLLTSGVTQAQRVSMLTKIKGFDSKMMLQLHAIVTFKWAAHRDRMSGF